MVKTKEIDEEAKARLMKEEEDRKQEAEALQKKKDRERKQKLKEKRQKIREEKERKRIRSIIDYPFKVIHNAAAVLSLIFFLVNFFGNSMELLASLYRSFLLFLVADIGGCIVVFAIFYVMSIRKEQELKDQIRQTEEQMKLEEERKKKEEQELLETQKVMLESNDDDLEAKRQEALRKFREMKESELIANPNEKNTKPALDIDEQLSRLPDDLLNDDFSAAGKSKGAAFGADQFQDGDSLFNFGDNSENPFITMPKT